MRDRVSTLGVFEPFQEYFQPTHYHLLRRDQDVRLIPMSAQSKSYAESIEGLHAFLLQNGPAQLASSTWKGDTRKRIEAHGNAFLIDGYEYSTDEVQRLLFAGLENEFLVIRDLDDDEPQKALVRIIVTNGHGNDPAISEAERLYFCDIPIAHIVRTGTAVGALVDRDIKGVAADEMNRDFIEEQAEVQIEAEMNADDHQKRARETGVGLIDDVEWVESKTAETKNSNDLRIEMISRINLDSGRYEAARALAGRQLFSFDRDPATGEIISGVVPNWDGLKDLVYKMARFAPQLEFFEVIIDPSGAKPVIVGVSPLPPYGRVYPFSQTTVAFIREHLDRKLEEHKNKVGRLQKFIHNSKLKLRRQFAEALYPQGLVPYQSVRWLGDIRRDLFSRNGVSLHDKVWAYRHGFLSYRLPQYGITPENWQEFISDFEYRWLRHLNNKYKHWLEDKVSIKYLASDFSEHLPEYYYYTSANGSGMAVVPMMDLPDGHDNSLEEILRLAKEKQVLALKPEDGSHGDGFYRFEYDGSDFLLNGEVASKERVHGVLANPDNKYLITEFIQMHSELARIYPDSVNTLRMIVFKRDGVTPEIGNAYLRIGSSESGYIDNTAAGGMMAEVDVNTGWFGNGQALYNGRVTECATHPDTGELIEGQLPNWDLVKHQVLEIAARIPQLEYLGFDIAITKEGIKLPEINRFPDYPRINKLTPETTEYLLYKLEQKKKLYGYDIDPPRTLIRLPNRGVAALSK